MAASHPPASGTLARQPFTLLLRGVAFRAGTWDNNDHGWREGATGRIAAKHTLPKPRLRSYVSESKLEENHRPASGALAGFQSRGLSFCILRSLNILAVREGLLDDLTRYSRIGKSFPREFTAKSISFGLPHIFHISLPLPRRSVSFQTYTQNSLGFPATR